MQIHMRYFASLREAVGKPDEFLTIPEKTTAVEIRAILLAQYPELAKALQRALCAVNHQYVSDETQIQEGDEVVFIPPVGGG